VSLKINQTEPKSELLDKIQCRSTTPSLIETSQGVQALLLADRRTHGHDRTFIR